MLEKLYDLFEREQETASVMDFLARFVKDGDTEERFLDAVRDTHHAGFIDGAKAVMSLFAEAKA